jgi:hypothetical protein
MNRTVEGLIGEIRGLSQDRVDSASREKVLDEVRAHLDASIQGRLELGLSRDDAETEVVESFGDPQKFVAKMGEQHPVRKRLWFDRATWHSLLFPTLAFAALLGFTQWRNDDSFLAGIALLLIWMIGAGWLFVASWKAKMPQILPVLAILILSTPLFAIAYSLGDLADGSFSIALGLSREVAQKELRHTGDLMRATKKLEVDFQSAADAHFLKSSGAAPMKPIWHETPDYMAHPDTFQLVAARSQADADSAWRTTMPKAYKRIAQLRQNFGMESFQLSKMLYQSFWLNALYHLPGGALIGASLAGFAATISFSAWTLRRLWRLIGRRNRLTRA